LKKIYSMFELVGDKAKVMKAQLKKSELFALWDFNPGECQLPEGVQEGEPIKIKIVGEYKDSEVNAWIVQATLKNGKRLTHRPNGVVLHIVKWHKNGVNPVVVGRRIQSNGWTRLALSNQFDIGAIAKFNRA